MHAELKYFYDFFYYCKLLASLAALIPRGLFPYKCTVITVILNI